MSPGRGNAGLYYWVTDFGLVAMPGAAQAVGQRLTKFPEKVLRLDTRMREERPKSIQKWILELEIEHRDLDEVVRRLSADSDVDQLQLTRLKKRKLQLKDQIARLKSQLIPDLDA